MRKKKIGSGLREAEVNILEDRIDSGGPGAAAALAKLTGESTDQKITLRGRVVVEDSWKEAPADPPTKEWAKKIVGESDAAEGKNGMVVAIEYKVPPQQKTEKSTTKTVGGIAGIFKIEIPKNATEIELHVDDGSPERLVYPSTSPEGDDLQCIVLKVPKAKGDPIDPPEGGDGEPDPKDEIPFIIPKYGDAHKTPLEPPFGTGKIIRYIKDVDNSKFATLGFTTLDTKGVPDIFYVSGSDFSIVDPEDQGLLIDTVGKTDEKSNSVGVIFKVKEFEKDFFNSTFIVVALMKPGADKLSSVQKEGLLQFMIGRSAELPGVIKDTLLDANYVRLILTGKEIPGP